MISMNAAAIAVATALMAAAPSAAQPQAWTADQTAVWSTVSRSWADETAENGRWPAAYVMADTVAWDNDWPMPRSGDSMAKWSRFNDKQAQTLQYELFPVMVQVRGDTAVAHYAGVIVAKRGDEKPAREKFAAVETLTRTGDGWKFLALTGFDIGD